MKKLLRTLLAVVVFASFWFVQNGSYKTVFAGDPVAPQEEAFNVVKEVPALEPIKVSELVEEAPQVAKAPEVAAEKKMAGAPTPKKTVAAAPASKYGTLLIPSIDLSKPIGAVGLTKSGNMDVLDDPSRVGWYNGGAVPGEVGSAVIGAHVYQAFADLKDVKVGDSIYVEKGGSKLRFVVRETAVYPYTDPTPLKKIFLRTDAARLNLITCYGKLTSDRSTYTHRLVVYATLAGTSS